MSSRSDFTIKKEKKKKSTAVAKLFGLYHLEKLDLKFKATKHSNVDVRTKKSASSCSGILQILQLVDCLMLCGNKDSHPNPLP